MDDDGAGYDFFLSYSRSDKDVARTVVRALRRLAVPWYRRSRRRVFRDEEELVTGRVLEEEIYGALDRSAMLVVLLSAATRRRGGWVTNEVTWWSELGKPADKLIFIVAQGEFGDVLPEGLSAQHGGGERLHADISAQVARRRPPRYRDILLEMAGVVAALTRRDRAAVYNQDKRQHRQLMQTVTAAVTVAVLGLVSAIVAVVVENGAATRASNLAAAQRRLGQDATVQKAVADLIVSAEQQRQIDPQLALRLGVAAIAIRETPDGLRSLITTLVTDHPMAQRDAGLGAIHDLAVSPDGRELLTGGDSGAKLWSITPTAVSPMATVVTVTPPASVGTVAMTAKGIAVVGVGSQASVFDIRDPKAAHRISSLRPTRNLIVRVCVTADGRKAIVVNLDGQAQIYDLSHPAAPSLAGILGTLAAPGSAALAGNGSLLAVGSDLEYRAEVFDLRSASPRPIQIPYTFTKPISTVAVSADGTRVAVAGNDGHVTLWNTRSAAHPALVGDWNPGIQHALAFSQDGRRLAGGGLDGRATVWSLGVAANPGRLASLDLHTGIVTTVAFSPDGRTLWTAGDDRIFSSLRMDLLPEPAQTAVLRDASADVFAVAYRPGTNELITGGNALSIERWDARTPESPHRLADLEAPHGQVSAIAWSADGSTSAVADGRQIIIADAAGHIRGTFTADDRLADFVAFTRDGQHLITAGNDHRIVLRTLGGATVKTIATQADALALSGQDVLAISRDTRHVTLIDVSDPVRPRAVATSVEPDQGDDIYDAAFSPDGTHLATAGRNHRGALWNVAQASTAPALSGFHDSAKAVAFNPSGRLLAVGSFDDTVRIWDVQDPSAPLLVATVKDQKDFVMDLAFSASGQLATVGRDGQILIYDTRQLDKDISSSQAQACLLAGGGLDKGQWDQYLKEVVAWRPICS